MRHSIEEAAKNAASFCWWCAGHGSMTRRC